MALRDWLAPVLQQPASAKVAISAIAKKGQSSQIARIAGIALANSPQLQAAGAVAASVEVFDREAFDERAAIIEANGVSREWAEGYATLCTMPRPSVYSLGRWQQIIDDGGRFLDAWGREAAALGWRAVDVFGVNPDAPECRYDGAGLVPLLTGRRVCDIRKDTAQIDCGAGIIQTFQRKTMAADAVALWLLK
ncbi:MAG: hypothetical protein WCD70_01925 [Alphaproteobacteria bacterium]